MGRLACQSDGSERGAWQRVQGLRDGHTGPRDDVCDRAGTDGHSAEGCAASKCEASVWVSAGRNGGGGSRVIPLRGLNKGRITSHNLG
jgi:hypothetical protein